MGTDPVIEKYLLAVGGRETDLQRRLREETMRLPRGRMQAGPETAQILAFLVRLLGARNCLEIGTFTGFSALAVAQALPAGGRLIACDVSEEWTAIGRRYWQEAGVADRIDLRIGPGSATLHRLIAEGRAGQFDFAFIDADKTGYDGYYEDCLTLLRPGGVIALDNMLWSGAVADPAINDADTVALRTLNAKIHGDPRVDMCLLPIGDGVNLVRKI
ncbi:MAG: class I SAM-dependent methyltransferase [Alphaproteobacteria bacterium]|jgi:predicted O-methyltransferase YrrM|nr:class I SAM-dependent methyltransferase [Alphaproteobacteria bacterium]